MIGHTVIRLEETSSTNDLARDFIENPDADGTVILADRQTKGKGRLGRSWYSPPGKGIYLSIILNRPLQGNMSYLLCPAVSLAIAQAVEKLSGLKVLIKWPNDLIVNGKKIGGVLVEKSRKAFIVGVGVNLNTDLDEFPEEIRGRTSSLKSESGKHYDKEEFMRELFVEFERIMALLPADGGKEVLNNIKARSFTLGKNVRVVDGGAILNGEAIGFESDGSLLLKGAGGKIVNIKSGELE